ncbi:MAG: hypothetical protein ACTSYR_02905 [Candidatus Odinarchaeia archaeon]
MKEDIWPYVMILPSSKTELINIFNSLFKSEIPLKILLLFKNNDAKIYQSDIIRNFEKHSNKSILKHLNHLVKARILNTGLEKITINQRKFWVKWYTLTKVGKYIKLLFSLHPTTEEVRRTIEELFYFYVYKIIKIGKKYNINDEDIVKIFQKALNDSRRNRGT